MIRIKPMFFIGPKAFDFINVIPAFESHFFFVNHNVITTNTQERISILITSIIKRLPGLTFYSGYARCYGNTPDFTCILLKKECNNGVLFVISVG